MSRHRPRPVEAGRNPADLARNHPPLYVAQAGTAVIPAGTPYRWYTELLKIRKNRVLRLRWHKRMIDHDFSQFYHIERLMAQHPPDWLGRGPGGALQVPNKILELVQQIPEG
jgi:hypothetical protein